MNRKHHEHGPEIVTIRENNKYTQSVNSLFPSAKYTVKFRLKLFPNEVMLTTSIAPPNLIIQTVFCEMLSIKILQYFPGIYSRNYFIRKHTNESKKDSLPNLTPYILGLNFDEPNKKYLTLYIPGLNSLNYTNLKLMNKYTSTI